MDRWLMELIDGLAEFDYMHPKLYAQYAGSNEYQPADCPCRLLQLVPPDLLTHARAYMDGWRTGHEDASRAAGLSAGDILAESEPSVSAERTTGGAPFGPAEHSTERP